MNSYRNPIIHADYSDPDIVRWEDGFILVASSFTCVPGLPLLHSRDLVNWRLVNHVCADIPLPGYERPRHGCGLWAPSIVSHAGRLFVYVCTPDEGLFMSSTDDPFGKWTPLVHVKKVTGWIDPCPFWDDDGKAYLLHAFAASRVGINAILHLCRMSSDGTEITDTGRIVVDALGRHHAMEGPKLFKRNGWYYISAPAGGIDTGYQVTMRSRSVYGPYEERLAIHEGDNGINGPRQGGFVTLDSGETWFAHFQGSGAYGRIVNLEPVAWKDDWMIIGEDTDGDGVGEPVKSYRMPDVGFPGRASGQEPCVPGGPVPGPQTSDAFDGNVPGLQWQWMANPRPGWYSLTARPGSLRLFGIPLPAGTGTFWEAGNILAQKFPAREFTCTVAVEPGQGGAGETGSPAAAGLIVTGMEYRYLAVSAGKGLLVLIRGYEESGERKERVEASAGIPAGRAAGEPGRIWLRVEVSHGAVCRFSWSADGGSFAVIGGEAPAAAGRWIGAKVGLFCIGGGYADFGRFDVTAGCDKT